MVIIRIPSFTEVIDIYLTMVKNAWEAAAPFSLTIVILIVALAAAYLSSLFGKAESL